LTFFPQNKQPNSCRLLLEFLSEEISRFPGWSQKEGKGGGAASSSW